MPFEQEETTEEATETTEQTGEKTSESDEEAPGGEKTKETKVDPEPDPVTFMDPNKIPAELLPAFKAMQASFTKGMQGIKGEKEKAEVMDELMKDPAAGIAYLAKKYGVELGETPKGETKPPVGETEKWIRDMIEEVVGTKLKDSLSPLQSAQYEAKAKADLAYLDANHPDWKLYEQVMEEVLKKHPTMAGDLDELYRISKAGFIEADKLGRASNKKASVLTTASSGKSTTVPSKIKGFDAAFKAACDKLKLPHDIKVQVE